MVAKIANNKTLHRLNIYYEKILILAYQKNQIKITMNYKEALEKAKEYSKFIGKQLHIEEHKEVITINKVCFCEIIVEQNKPNSKPKYKTLADLDLKKDNSEKLKGKNLDVVIEYQISIKTENKSSDFEKKYPLL